MNTEKLMPYGQLGLIGMRGCEDLTGRIDSYLTRWRAESHPVGQLAMEDAPVAGPGLFHVKAVCPRFNTGEGKALIRQSVRGYDLYIVADMFNYGVTYSMYNMERPMSPDDHFQDLKRIIAAAGGKARRITVIMPMLYEGRQHRRFARESLDCALALQELVSMGVENIITFDAHDSRVQNAVPLSGFENIRPTYQMLKALFKAFPDFIVDPSRLMIVSPDEGAMTRSIYYSSVLGVELGMFYKRRDYTRLVHGRNPIVKHEFLGDNVAGRDVIVVDDMISSGDSILSIAQMLRELGARRVIVFATYGLFTEGLARFDEAYEQGVLSKVFTTNLVYRPDGLRDKPWYHEVDMAKYISYIIETLNYDSSISDLLEPSARIHTLLERKRREQRTAPQEGQETLFPV
ncbi:MAG: ribose-phosphate pyrophosphokinase [Oscillospiraceae bacterium]|jgi:ribose-phosphate pyrophosphokinase|nr:ribose-phosphate pyrophosphokinase [Oscillospiraceae bacterium]